VSRFSIRSRNIQAEKDTKEVNLISPFPAKGIKRANYKSYFVVELKKIMTGTETHLVLVC